jgi:hypothetical protein
VVLLVAALAIGDVNRRSLQAAMVAHADASPSATGAMTARFSRATCRTRWPR